MIARLRKDFVPALRARGFTGAFPHFRRLTAGQTDLLTVQFDKWGGGFVVEVATAPAGRFKTPWGGVVPAVKLTAHDLDRRLRLGARRASVDHWFRYDEGTTAAAVAAQVLAKLVQAERWWAKGP